MNSQDLALMNHDTKFCYVQQSPLENGECCKNFGYILHPLSEENHHLAMFSHHVKFAISVSNICCCGITAVEQFAT